MAHPAAAAGGGKTDAPKRLLDLDRSHSRERDAIERDEITKRIAIPFLALNDDQDEKRNRIEKAELTERSNVIQAFNEANKNITANDAANNAAMAWRNSLSRPRFWPSSSGCVDYAYGLPLDQTYGSPNVVIVTVDQKDKHRRLSASEVTHEKTETLRIKSVLAKAWRTLYTTNAVILPFGKDFLEKYAKHDLQAHLQFDFSTTPVVTADPPNNRILLLPPKEGSMTLRYVPFNSFSPQPLIEAIPKIQKTGWKTILESFSQEITESVSLLEYFEKETKEELKTYPESENALLSGNAEIAANISKQKLALALILNAMAKNDLEGTKQLVEPGAYTQFLTDFLEHKRYAPLTLEELPGLNALRTWLGIDPDSF